MSSADDVTKLLQKQADQIYYVQPVVRKHMAAIGAKGGAKRKDDPDRYILAHEAARASWLPQSREKRIANRLSKKSAKS